MTIINQIIDTERESEEIVVKAHEEARGLVSDAEEKAREIIASFKETLKDDRSRKMTAKKEVLKEIYRDILGEGSRISGEIEKKAVSKKESAISLVLNSF